MGGRVTGRGVLATLAGATPPRHTVEIIVDAALADEHERLVRDLDQAGKDDAAHRAAHQEAIEAAAELDIRDGSLANRTPHVDAITAEPFDLLPNTTRVADALDAIRDKVLASQVTFIIEPLDWRDRIRLQAEHQPRDKNLVDARMGYNTDTYLPALVRECTTSVTDASGDTVTEVPEATWTHLFGDPQADPPIKPALNFGSVNRLTGAAQDANDGGAAVPQSARSSLGIQDFAASSTRPGPGASLPAAGEGGSRPTSPKSSTTKKKAPSKAKSSAT